MKSHHSFVAYTWLALTLLPMLASPAVAGNTDSSAAWAQGYQALSRLGTGFVVWESNRTGNWRIFKINLDGTGLRQLTPDEIGRDQFCPHISPDGKNLAYLSYPAGEDGYSLVPRGRPIPLHIINTDGADDHIVAPDARAYGEDRAVVWLNNHELVYIDADHMTRRLDIDTGKSTPMLKEPVAAKQWGDGWLFNPTLKFATTGVPTFSPYNAPEQQVTPRQQQNGCQPYFTHDGVWGFWMGGGGGPINRFNLATRQSSAILQRHDLRMPADRDYLYFPMISANGRLFAFAASPGVHDHFKADYDIFVAQCDPKTLQLIGKPVRYTFNKACDRFPDVFLAPSGGTNATAPGTPAAGPASPETTASSVSPVDWPSQTQGLAFLWATSAAPNLFRRASDGMEQSYALASRGMARLDHNYAMQLSGGAYLADGADNDLLLACKKSNAISIEALITPTTLTPQAPLRIITFSSDLTSPDFTLGQYKDRLYLRLRTSENAPPQNPASVDLCPLTAGKPCHIVVTYSPGRLVCYCNGKQTVDTNQVKGDLSNWTAQHLLFGDEWTGTRNWPGTLEGIALFNQVLTPEQTQADFERYSAFVQLRKPVVQAVVQARLVARSTTPTLQEIRPYQEALVVDEYRVGRILSGNVAPGKIWVAHWAIMGGNVLPGCKDPIGTRAHLVLESYEDNPQLESIYMDDTLPAEGQNTLYYDVSDPH